MFPARIIHNSLILALSWLLLPGDVDAEEALLLSDGWQIRTWQTDEGLPDNNVTGVGQSADGFLWVATLGGLMRFDGASFEEFSTTHLPGVPNRNVRKMYLDRQGRLWLVMARGVIIRVGETSAHVFDSADGVTVTRVPVFAEDKEGNVWFVGGNQIFRIQGDKVDHFGVEEGLPEGGSSWLATDTRGQLWFARGPQVGVFRDGRWQTLLTLDSGSVRLAAARAGGVWVYTASRVLKFQEGGEPQELARLSERVAVQVMLEDRKGVLWIGTEAGGLLRVQGKEVSHVPVSHPEVSSLAEDREGNLWVGTAGGGLSLLRPRTMEVVTVKSGLPLASVLSVCQDTEGWVWVALQNGSLVHGRGSEWGAVTNADGQSVGDVTCVAPAFGGGVWIGTHDRGLQRWQAGRLQEWGRGEGLGSQSVRSLLQASNGELWVATDLPSRLRVFKDGEFEGVQMPVEVRVIRALAEGVGGTIWAGTSDGQILRVQNRVAASEPAAQPEPPYAAVRCLLATADGTVWIGTAGSGVGRWRDGRFARIGTAQGLRDDYVSQMLADGQGGLWLTGNRGLFQVRLEELETVAEGRSEHVRSIAYGRSEGLPSIQPYCENSPAAWRGAEGELWFATRNGLLAVHPQEISDNPTPPPVLLSAVKVDDHPRLLLDSHSPLRLPSQAKLADLRQPGAALQLPARHTKLEFLFTALSFTSPENVHFRHRLLGFDTEWIEAGTQRSARYPRLPAGRYEFEVKACNEAGVWSQTGSGLAIVVHPFLWQTWWFRALLLVTFTSGVIAAVRYVSFRRLRERMRLLEQQAVLDKERSRIAKDLHDDLGASMTQMTLLLELAMQHRSKPEAVLERVQDGLRAGREAIKSLDAAVWAVNPSNNTLPELVAYIGQFGMEFLQQANIRCELDLPDHPPERVVSSELRHNLFLIAKEALNNIVRHARARNVQLKIDVTPAILELSIADDGAGIEHIPHDALADGLRNMRQRAEEIHARFDLETKPGLGTRIVVTYPWPATS